MKSQKDQIFLNLYRLSIKCHALPRKYFGSAYCNFSIDFDSAFLDISICQNGLLKWVNSFEKKPEEVFVVHGEDAVCEAFTSCLKDEYKFKARAPYSGDVFDLIAGEWTEWGSRERIQKKPKQSSAYIRLLTASERLKSVIEHNEGGTNKDLGKFADQIIALCDKWER